MKEFGVIEKLWPNPSQRSKIQDTSKLKPFPGRTHKNCWNLQGKMQRNAKKNTQKAQILPKKMKNIKKWCLHSLVCWSQITNKKFPPYVCFWKNSHQLWGAMMQCGTASSDGFFHQVGLGRSATATVTPAVLGAPAFLRWVGEGKDTHGRARQHFCGAMSASHRPDVAPRAPRGSQPRLLLSTPWLPSIPSPPPAGLPTTPPPPAMSVGLP